MTTRRILRQSSSSMTTTTSPSSSTLNRSCSGETGNGVTTEPSYPTITISSSVTQQESQEQQQQPARLSPFVIQVTAMAGLGGILFGYDLGVISSALPPMTTQFGLSNAQQEVAVSILYVGGGVGAALGGSLCDAFGRKRAILWTDVFFLVGASVLYVAPSFHFIVLGRIIVGFAIAVSGIADVSYLHEIAPIQWRGSIVSVNEACISLGFLLAFLVGSIFSDQGNDSGWRAMFGISGIVALCQLVGMWTMPESPTWLREQGRLEESEAALQRIGGQYTVCSGSGDNTTSASPSQASPATASHFASTYDSLAGSPTRETPPNTSSEVSTVPEMSSDGLLERCLLFHKQILYLLQQWRVFAKDVTNRYRKQAYIALFLAVTQQFCGQTNVLSYAPLIFAGASGKNDSSMDYVRGWSTLSIGIVKFLVTALVIWKIESVGRRTLLLIGMATIALGLLLLTAAFAGPAHAPSTTASGDAVVEATTWGFVLALPGVLLVVCGYSMSFGPLTWLLTSELFPTDIRGRALGTSTIVTYMCGAVVTYTFLSAQARVGASVVFATYWLITSLGLLFAYFAIPDTKEKTEQEIETELNSMLWWKGRSHRGYETFSLFSHKPSSESHLRETELS